MYLRCTGVVWFVAAVRTTRATPITGEQFLFCFVCTLFKGPEDSSSAVASSIVVNDRLLAAQTDRQTP